MGTAVTVSLTYEPGRAAFAGRGDTFQRLRPLAAEHRGLGPRVEHYAPDARCALHHLERHLFEPGRPSPVPAGEVLRLLEGGERAELELVAEEIGGLLRRGVQPGRDRGGAPLSGDDRRAPGGGFRAPRHPLRACGGRLPFAHTATGRALLGLLKAAFADREEAWGRVTGRAVCAALLAWLRAPGCTAGTPSSWTSLEWRARRAGVSRTGGAGTRAVGGRALATGDPRPAAGGGRARAPRR